MRSVFFYTLAISVALVFSQQPFVRYPEYLRKAVPPHYNNDQKTADRGVDKNARRHKVEPRQPPLRPHPEVPWLRWVQEGRWAAQVDKNTEQHRVRARLLEEKLKPNQFVFKPRINPQLKPKVNHQNGNVRMKREAKKPQLETVHKEKEAEENVRHKRDATIFELEPEEAKQPQVDQADRKYGDRIQQPVRRDKRQILYLIDRPQQLLYRGVKTTPNPFIRDTHVDDYDIIRPEVGEREGMIPTVESDSSDPDSYPLVSETSDLEYESDYTISMSDSEEWNNYPLTTPSGPNPGWRLSTLADIYQKQRRSRTHVLRPKKSSHNIKAIFQAWPIDENYNLRVKRSPKERKPKIGAYKEKIKQRRKMKDMRKKRRIIRNSKEDKAVKEDLKDEKAIERLLQRPRIMPRQTAYQLGDASKEILWTNGTHNIVEDTEATVKWINETHYIIYKDKDNSTDEWYHQHHILCYNDEWENKTSSEKREAVVGLEEDDDEDEELKVKKDEKTKSDGKAGKKKGEKRKKGKKVSDKKAVKPKKKSTKSKKIMTVKNVDEEPKDPRKDQREWKSVKQNLISSDETTKMGKKDNKIETDDEKDISSSKERKKKKKKKKKDIDKTEDDSSKKKKRKKSKTGDQDKKHDSDEKREKKKKKEKVLKDLKKDMDVDKKEKKRVKEKKQKKKVKSDKSSEADVKKKKKKRKDKDDSLKKEKERERKKRSIYHSDESKSGKVRWEKVKQRESDGWTVIDDQEDKAQVYDTSYELVETKNLTKNTY